MCFGRSHAGLLVTGQTSQLFIASTYAGAASGGDAVDDMTREMIARRCCARLFVGGRRVRVVSLNGMTPLLISGIFCRAPFGYACHFIQKGTVVLHDRTPEASLPFQHISSTTSTKFGSRDLSRREGRARRDSSRACRLTSQIANLAVVLASCRFTG